MQTCRDRLQANPKHYYNPAGNVVDSSKSQRFLLLVQGAFVLVVKPLAGEKGPPVRGAGYEPVPRREQSQETCVVLPSLVSRSRRPK